MLNLSESTYILKHPQNLDNFLKENKGKNFVALHQTSEKDYIGWQGLDHTFVECENRMWNLGKRKLPRGIHYDGGSDWVCLNREFVMFLVSEQDSDPLLDGLFKMLEYSILASESFFQTLLINSKYCHSYVPNNLLAINWKRNIGCKCQQRHIVDWCGCSPNDIKPQDWKNIATTFNKNLFFARKFEPVVSQEILNMIDDWIFGESHSEIHSRNSYWNNIYHHQDLSPEPDSATLKLAKLLAQNVTNEPFEILEIHTYHYKDELKGFLIHLHLKSGPQIEIMYDLIKSRLESSIKERNAKFAIGSSFDPKELFFRNFLSSFGQTSQTQLMYELDATEEKGHFTARVLWIDPLSTPRALQNLTSKMPCHPHPLGTIHLGCGQS